MIIIQHINKDSTIKNIEIPYSLLLILSGLLHNDNSNLSESIKSISNIFPKCFNDDYFNNVYLDYPIDNISNDALYNYKEYVIYYINRLIHLLN